MEKETFSAPIVYTVIDDDGVPTGQIIVRNVPWNSPEWDEDGHFIYASEIEA